MPKEGGAGNVKSWDVFDAIFAINITHGAGIATTEIVINNNLRIGYVATPDPTGQTAHKPFATPEISPETHTVTCAALIVGEI